MLRKENPKGFLARRLGDGNVLIITIFQVLTEYAAGSFLKHRSSKLRSNNQCYNTEILTQVKGHLDGSGGLYLKATAQLKQEQRPNSTLQHKSPSCASHAINTLDLTSRIEATYCRFTVVEKKPELHHVFSRENGQNVWHLTKTCQITNLGFLLTLRSPIPVCLHALIM